MKEKNMFRVEHLGIAGGGILLLALFLTRGGAFVKSKYPSVNISKETLIPIVAICFISVLLGVNLYLI